MITIHAFLPQAECELSGRSGEAVEISAADGSIRRGIVSLSELGKLLRFRHRQQQKQSEQNHVPAQPAAGK